MEVATDCSWPICLNILNRLTPAPIIRVNEWVTFAYDGTGPADESKRTKRIQGWSRLNWLGGILIVVSWHIHFK